MTCWTACVAHSSSPGCETAENLVTTLENKAAPILSDSHGCRQQGRGWQVHRQPANVQRVLGHYYFSTTS